jgi:uncharacterized protein (TIGR02145 family)
MNLKEKFDIFVKQKHKSKLQLALVLLLLLVSLWLLWQMIHLWIFVVAVLAAANLLAIVSYQKDMAVPFLEAFLSKEYLRIKAKAATKPFWSFLNRHYQGFLQYLLILFLNSQKSFELFVQDGESIDVKFDADRQTLKIRAGESDTHIKKYSAEELVEFYKAKLADQPALSINDLFVLFARSKKEPKLAPVKNWSVEEFFDLYQLKKRKLVVFSLSASMGIILSIILLVFIIPSWHKVNAFTYGWVQTSWTGGASTTTVAVHPGDKTSWLQYFWASANMFISTSLTPNSVATSSTDTTTEDFSAGTFNNAYATSSMVIMRKPNGANCGSNTECTSDYCPEGLCEAPPIACDGSEGALTCGNKCTYSGVIYPTVQVNATTTTQCWIAKDLNVGTMITATSTMANDSVLEKWCYNNHEINPSPTTTECTWGNNCGGCDTDGAFYTWSEMMALPSACNSSSSGACAPASYVTGSGASAKRQGICPTGWHIPSDYEWWGMENYFDSTVVYDNPNYYTDQIASTYSWVYRGTDIGTKLACTTSGNPWTNCGSSGLKFPMAGRRDSSNGYTLSRGGSSGWASYWTSVQYSSISGTERGIYAGTATQMQRRADNKGTYGMHVRCLKD